MPAFAVLAAAAFLVARGRRCGRACGRRSGRPAAAPGRRPSGNAGVHRRRSTCGRGRRRAGDRGPGETFRLAQCPIRAVRKAPHGTPGVRNPPRSRPAGGPQRNCIRMGVSVRTPDQPTVTRHSPAPAKSAPSQSCSTSTTPGMPSRRTLTSDTAPEPTTRNRCRPLERCSSTPEGCAAVPPPLSPSRRLASCAALTTSVFRWRLRTRVCSAPSLTLYTLRRYPPETTVPYDISDPLYGSADDPLIQNVHEWPRPLTPERETRACLTTAPTAP